MFANASSQPGSMAPLTMDAAKSTFTPAARIASGPDVTFSDRRSTFPDGSRDPRDAERRARHHPGRVMATQPAGARRGRSPLPGRPARQARRRRVLRCDGSPPRSRERHPTPCASASNAPRSPAPPSGASASTRRPRGRSRRRATLATNAPPPGQAREPPRTDHHHPHPDPTLNTPRPHAATGSAPGPWVVSGRVLERSRLPHTTAPEARITAAQVKAVV